MDGDTCDAPTANDTPCQHPTTDDGDSDRCWVDSHNEATTDAGNGGRPSKLSYERQEEIATALEAGKSLNSAARMAGVTPQVVYNWLDRGEAEREQGNDNEYTEFLERITHAKGHGEDFYFGLALELAKENGDHRFIASLMKQRYPDSWGDTETGVDAEGQTVINLPESVTEQWERAPNR